MAILGCGCMVGMAQEADTGAKAGRKGNKKGQAGMKGGWVSMFNGKSLAGWTQKNGWATYAVQPADGDNPAAIVGTTAEGSPNSFLCTVRRYGDFELEFEVKVSNELNSGVQIRSTTKQGAGKNIYNTGRVNGPQVEIEASGEKGAEAGYIYGEALGGGWMTPEEKLVPHKHFKDGEWNKYRIVTSGPNIKVWINDQMVSDLTDAERFKTHPKGFIGLQVHGIGKKPGPYTAAWRNLRIREPKGARGGKARAGKKAAPAR
jgi:hypothetical protein